MPKNQQSSPAGLLISTDLFFISKVTGTASELHGMIRFVGDDTTALDVIENAETPFKCLIIDLNSFNKSLDDLMTSVNGLKHRPTVIAFGPHVHVEQLQNARDAGCDHVMPRSRFSSSLPELLKQYLLDEK